MTGEIDNQRLDQELETEVRQSRKFTPQEALGRLAGAGAMKGASVVSRQQQAENEIGIWLRSHIVDPVGMLILVLHRELKGSELLLSNVDQPLNALSAHCERVIASDHLLKELVREADVEWGRAMEERPYFDRDGSPPSPDDPYTVKSVRDALTEVLRQLSS